MKPLRSVDSIIRTGVIGVIAAAVAQGAAPQPAAAQAGPNQPGQPAPRGPSVTFPPGVQAEPTLSVDFPGGTVADYVRAVQAAAADQIGQAANVVLPAEAAQVKVPPITLRDVSVQTALEALTYTLAEGSPDRFDIEPFGRSYPAAPAQAYAIRHFKASALQARALARGVPVLPSVAVEVFSIRELSELADGEVIISVDKSTQVRGLTPETILTSVEAALTLADIGGSPPELKFHQDSGLLIVRGSPQQLELVRGVLRELRNQVNQRTAARKAKERAEAEREYRRKRLEVEVRLQEQEVQLAESNLAKLREGIPLADGQVLKPHPNEVAQAELSLARDRARLRMLQLEAERPIGEGEPSSHQLSPDGRDVGELLKTIDELRQAVAQLQAEQDRSKGAAKPQR